MSANVEPPACSSRAADVWTIKWIPRLTSGAGPSSSLKPKRSLVAKMVRCIRPTGAEAWAPSALSHGAGTVRAAKDRPLLGVRGLAVSAPVGPARRLGRLSYVTAFDLAGPMERVPRTRRPRCACAIRPNRQPEMWSAPGFEDT
jgi:hypothetical protein